jgi:hypothetical protein
MSDPDSIEIRDESTHEEQRFQLLIDGGPRALLKKRTGTVEIVWQVYGPQYWPEAKVLMQGLLELSVLADQLSGEKNGKKTSRDED